MKFGAILGSSAMALALGFGGLAQAASDTGGSEYFHQAAGGANEITPMFSYANGIQKMNDGTADTKTNGIKNLGVQYEYGINEMLSVYGNIGYGSVGVDRSGSSTASGLNDLNLGVKGTSAMGMGSLRYGLNLNLPFEKAKVDGGGRATNASTGGLGLTPYVGYDMVAGPGMWGARLSYNYKFNRSYDYGSYNPTVTGGSVLGLGTFYEFNVAEMIFGGKLQYDIAQDTTIGRQNASDLTGPTGNIFTAGLYTRINVGPGNLLAGIDYGMLAGNKPSGTDSIMNSVINVGYRVAF